MDGGGSGRRCPKVFFLSLLPPRLQVGPAHDHHHALTMLGFAVTSTVWLTRDTSW